QHWVYLIPDHTPEQRLEAWQQINHRFTPKALDVSGLENYRAYSWQRQLHLYEVPFYYIEYGIAQLGAIGLWQQFKQNKEEALNHYRRALSLGGTKPLPELYKAAGLAFNFSANHIHNLVAFVQQQMEAIEQA
ncbi:MAG TPA: M3 family metallopeptidase, partial [Phnomibacter sp.]|nr:M3 family metallopeptidase [Phnomibacter sp.]